MDKIDRLTATAVHLQLQNFEQYRKEDYRLFGETPEEADLELKRLITGDGAFAASLLRSKPFRKTRLRKAK
jgi:hypothetical protein